MSFCQHSRDGSHQFEFVKQANGVSFWRCMNAMCGEIMEQSEDSNGG